ncbi:hypothetical protein BGZ95_006722 [Linnemannia exigua]|uniref:Uncharacterized protein n=1 Tax=Linnemannia exigua TaxID=604196 RepID=A0AAD4DG81_9FUNG|nr:hypothetical protein BGZ95_006722 [Linnemannia exigua]
MVITGRVVPYNYTWLTYYLLATAGLGTLLTALWPFKSRIYENGRPMVQEIVLDGLMAGLYLFAGAWQLYLTFANQLPIYDNTVHCRLWQTQLVGCVTNGAVFAIITLIWIVLFRRRPLAFKDLPETLKDSEMIASPRMEESSKREQEQDRQEEIAAIAAEAERRAALARPKPMPQPKPQPRPTHPYQQQQKHQQQRQQYPLSRVTAPTHLQHQNSASYLNQGYETRESPLPQSNYSNDDGDNYYNSNYAQQQAYEMTPTSPHGGYGRHGGVVPATAPVINSRVGTPLGNPYSEDPLSPTGANANSNGYYPATAVTFQAQHAQHGYNNEYVNGQFTPGETFDDPSSQEAQAHLAYANQLREQQLYHEQMAEALQKQNKQKALMQQQSFYNDNTGPCTSDSTTNFVLAPQNSGMQPVSIPPTSYGSTNIVAGGDSTYTAPGPSAMSAAPISRPSSDFVPAPYGRTNTSNVNISGMVTPASIGGSRIAGSPQLYNDDTATIPDSQYSYDRYRAEVLGDLRPAPSRSATAPTSTPGAPQDLTPRSENSSYHDYKVQLSSPVADQGRISISSSNGGVGSSSQPQRNQGYVPPPNKSRTMWS